MTLPPIDGTVRSSSNLLDKNKTLKIYSSLYEDKVFQILFPNLDENKLFKILGNLNENEIIEIISNLKENKIIGFISHPDKNRNIKKVLKLYQKNIKGFKKIFYAFQEEKLLERLKYLKMSSNFEKNEFVKKHCNLQEETIEIFSKYKKKKIMRMFANYNIKPAAESKMIHIIEILSNLDKPSSAKIFSDAQIF